MAPTSSNSEMKTGLSSKPIGMGSLGGISTSSYILLFSLWIPSGSSIYKSHKHIQKWKKKKQQPQTSQMASK